MTRLSLSHGRAPRPLELLAVGLPLAVAGLVGLVAMLILGGCDERQCLKSHVTPFVTTQCFPVGKSVQCRPTVTTRIVCDQWAAEATDAGGVQ